MNNFNRLQEQVLDGALRLIHIEAVPRSVSTALARAINEFEGNSIYVNEPFNRYRQDVDIAAGYLLEAADPITNKSDEPVTIVTKSTSRNLSQANFNDWISVADAVVWSVRDPLVQMGSLVTRIANDLRFEPEADNMDQHELIIADYEAVDESLRSGPDSYGRPYSKTSWVDIGNHFRTMPIPKRSVVIDGGAFTSNPTKVLVHACGKLGLTYSDRMVNGWEGKTVNVNTGYNLSRDPSELAWTNHAMLSTGVESIHREALDLGQLPSTLRDHITRIAIPTYQEIMKFGGSLYPDTSGGIDIHP
jgi:hypothetical protein